MKTDEDSHEAKTLLGVMHDFSEERCAGWLIDMEFRLWSAMERDDKYDCDGDPTLIRILQRLAADAGGWWVHCNTVARGWEETGGRVFLPTDEWKAIYAAQGPLDGEEE
jgi:hypothetical protein